MSLLLDALKKAEQSKREKVAEVAGGHRGPSGQPQGGTPVPGGDLDLELRLEPLPEDSLFDGSHDVGASGAEPEASEEAGEDTPPAEPEDQRPDA